MAREWDYNSDAPVALGVFYERAAPTLDEKIDPAVRSGQEKELTIRDFLASRQ
jgi:hypothetical protein